MRQILGRALVMVLAVVVTVTLTAGAADARSFRLAGGYTGQHTHVTWAGPGVGLIVWTVATDFSSYTPCGSSTAGVTVDAAWNSASLHNGAELDILFSAQRSDGRHFQLGKVFKITKAAGWPGHPAFGGQFRASVYTPRGMYLKSGTMTSWIVNGGVPYWGPASNNTVTFSQHTKSC